MKLERRRYRGSKITGLLYIATVGYMDEIVRHGKTKMVAASGFKSSRAYLAIRVLQGKKYYYKYVSRVLVQQ